MSKDISALRFLRINTDHKGMTEYCVQLFAPKLSPLWMNVGSVLISDDDFKWLSFPRMDAYLKDISDSGLSSPIENGITQIYRAAAVKIRTKIEELISGKISAAAFLPEDLNTVDNAEEPASQFSDQFSRRQ